MSFKDRRASRVSRQAKSFVLTHDNPEGHQQLSNITGRIENPSDINLQKHVAQETRTEPSVAQHAPITPPERAVYPSGCYSTLPPVLSIRKTNERGRGLWSDVGISAGTVLFSVRPHVHVLSRSQLNLYCSSCCAPGPQTGLKRCTKCKTIFYCGNACQKADWYSHKQECDALQIWASSAPRESSDINYTIPPEAVRCLARIIWKRKKLKNESIWWKEIDEMQSHRRDQSESMVDSHVHLAHALVKYMGMESPRDLINHGINGIGELVDLISKFTSNSFTLTTPALSPVGVTVSPIAALMNHSCDPNIAVVFPRSNSSSPDEPTLSLIAIKDIPPGAELFTSYIDITLPTSNRQKELREIYNFTCSCSTCSPQVSEEDWRERMWCPRKCGGTCPLPASDDDVVKCSNCRTTAVNTGEIVDLIRVGNEALKKATGLQFKDPLASLRLTENMIPLLTSQFPNSTHPLLGLVRLSQNLQISALSEKPSQPHLEMAIRFATMNIEGLAKILRFGHPVRALALTELGKLYAVDEPDSDSENHSLECITPASGDNKDLFKNYQHPRGPDRLRRAVQVLQQAYNELCIAFGRKNNGGAVGIEIRETLSRLEKELAVWDTGIRDTLDDKIAENNKKKVPTKT